MLNPLSKLLYFENREKKKELMQKLYTLSETGVRLVVIGCFAYAGGITVYSKKLFFHSLKSQPEKKKKKKRHFSSIPHSLP